jgi:hypothetical protein
MKLQEATTIVEASILAKAINICKLLFVVLQQGYFIFWSVHFA